MIKKYEKMCMSLALALVGLGIFVGSFSVKAMATNTLGPEVVPRVVAVAIMVLALVDAFGEFKKAQHTPVVKVVKEETAEKKPFTKKYSFVLTLALMAMYYCMLEPIGFMISTATYLFLQILVFSHYREPKKIAQYVLISVLTSVGIYFLFVKVFIMILPAGILG